MKDQTHEQEDEVYDVQVQGVGNILTSGDDTVEVIYDIGQTCNASDRPQDLAVLHLFSGRIDLIDLFFLVFQQSGIDNDGMFLFRMHCIQYQRHTDQDDQTNDQVDGMKNSITGAGYKLHTTGGVAAAEGQRYGSGQTGVPNDETGISGSNEQTVVNATDAAGNFLCQQCAGDQTKAPVQPAANGGNESGDQDGAALVFCQRSNGTQTLLTNLCRGHRRTQHQNQRHLHCNGKQTPKTGAAAPSRQDLDGSHAGSEHCSDVNDDG